MGLVAQYASSLAPVWSPIRSDIRPFQREMGCVDVWQRCRLLAAAHGFAVSVRAACCPSLSGLCGPLHICLPVLVAAARHPGMVAGLLVSEENATAACRPHWRPTDAPPLDLSRAPRSLLEPSLGLGDPWVVSRRRPMASQVAGVGTVPCCHCAWPMGLHHPRPPRGQRE